MHNAAVLEKVKLQSIAIAFRQSVKQRSKDRESSKSSSSFVGRSYFALNAELISLSFAILQLGYFALHHNLRC